MKNYISLLLLVLLSLTGCRATATTSSSMESDTTLQEFTQLIPAIQVPELNLAEGQQLRLSTPNGNITLMRAGSYLALQGSQQVIRHTQTKTIHQPVKIKDKSQVTINENSHNSDKSKDKSKVKAELNENSKNKEKKVSQNPLQLLLIFLGLFVGVTLYLKYKRVIKLP